MPRPDLSKVPAFYHNYISQVKEEDLLPALQNNTASTLHFLNSIAEQKYNYRYAEGKWTIKDILQHIIDAERIFSYRALRIARKDKTPLPGFDENLFAAHAKTDRRKWTELVDEFATVRRATEILFASFDEEQLLAEGITNNQPIYVLGIGFICAGHCIHHQNIIAQRYL